MGKRGKSEVWGAVICSRGLNLWGGGREVIGSGLRSQGQERSTCQAGRGFVVQGRGQGW